MLHVTLAWLLGIALFQQQSQLWSVWQIGFLAIILLTLFVLTLSKHGRNPFTSTKIFQTYFSSPLIPPQWRRAILNSVKPASVFLLVLCLGFTYAQIRAHFRLQDSLAKACEQKPLRIQGVIVSVPERNERGQHVEFKVERLFHASCHVPQHISLNLYENSFKQAETLSQPPLAKPLPSLHAGERWLWQVKLKRPHGSYNPHGFDYEAWSLSNNIRATGNIQHKAGMKRLDKWVWQPAALIAGWRERVGARIARVLGPSREAGVIRALVIGEDSQMTRKDWQMFVDTGINHLVSISGLHITMLASLAYAFTLWCWRRRPQWGLQVPAKVAASLFGMVVALAYAALAGFSVPTQRTLYMLMTVALLLCVKKQWPFSFMLATALWVVTLIDPWAVLAPGFWLSFGAVGVLAFAMGGRLRPAVSWQSAIQAQWVVTIAFVPVVLLLFNQCSLVAPLANAIAIPLVSFLVVPLGIAGALLPIDWALHVAHWCLSLGLLGLAWLAHLPWAVWFHATPTLAQIVLAWLGVCTLLMPRGWPLRWLGLLLLLPLLHQSTPDLKQGEMRATIIDVGQGLSVLVQTQHHQLLYDAGAQYHAESDAGQRIVLPYLRHLGTQDLDMAIVSHDDSDHVGGMSSVLTEVPAKQVLTSLTAEATFFQQLNDLNLTIQHLACRDGQSWQWDGVRFDMLWPTNDLPEVTKDNDKSCVLKISTADSSLLLTGDIEKSAEARLVEAHAEKLNSDVLTMPHHGSKTSSTRAFVEAVAPTCAIATNGYLNRFGHPKIAVVQRYQALDAQVLQSDQHGAVIVDFKRGKAPKVTAWREAEPRYWHEVD